eukprot:TRINITY_DN871_c0_g2_i1.p1 TRINITY_DN871_c0_g2~~TRINITY_DN871_c0_g2_i1.p1  ORF type:complete len:327 (+),score=101.36 TRINITY_DN871_c0_g2_i1:48-983(+)
MTATVTIMDGGMGSALRMRFPEKLTRDPLWSARLLTTPEGMTEVQKLHEEYIDAGAEYITTNNYACVPLYLDTTKEFSCVELTHRAVNLARAAVDKKGAGSVILSLPPLRQSYSPEVTPLEEAHAFYNQIVREVSHKVDLIMAETVSATANAQAPCEVAEKEGRPLLLSFTVNDLNNGSLRSGECISDAVRFLDEKRLKHKGILINCSTPHATTPALAKLLESDHQAEIVGCYPNSFKPIPADWNHHKDGPPKPDDLAIPEFVGSCKKWYAMGKEHAARRGTNINFFVGGCCGILPQHIQALSSAFCLGSA